MPDWDDESYNRRRQALYLTGLLPDDFKEARAVILLVSQFIDVAEKNTRQRDDDDAG